MGCGPWVTQWAVLRYRRLSTTDTAILPGLVAYVWCSSATGSLDYEGGRGGGGGEGGGEGGE